MKIQEILPQFGSYISDMEQCLEMDAETWQDYLASPAPYLRDLLSDFNELSNEIAYHEKAALIDTAVKKYLGE